jgi:hypothetical protein
MARITVSSTRRTVYTPRTGRPYEVEATPRVRELIAAGVLTDLSPKPASKPRKAASAPAPVVGVTSDPIDHEGAST